MNPLLPVMDFNRGVLIARKDGNPAAHPCGGCVPWSIYAVCWRSGGCGTDACSENIYLDSPPSPACGLTKFVFIGTVLDKLYFGPVTAPLTGTAEIEFVIDQVSVDNAIVICTQGLECGAEYNFSELEESLTNASGWHSIKAYVVWKDEGGVVKFRETYSCCLAVGVCPTGDDAPVLHDVMLLPGSSPEVCINETLMAVHMCGSYKSYFDAHFVRTYWAEIIDTWAEKCVCPGTCESGPVDRNGGFSSTYPIGNTNVSANLIAEGLGFIACTPSQYPIYVKFTATFIAPSGVSLYMKYYDEDGNEIGETEIFDATAYDYTVPPCTRVEFIVVNSNEEEAVDVAVGFSAAYYSNFPDPDTWQTDPPCPYEQDISDMVPSHDIALREWLPSHAEEVQAWWEGQQET